MTTVAWDGHCLAADRRITEDKDITAEIVKVRRTRDGRLIGACGPLDEMIQLLDWLENAGERPELPEKTSAEAVEIRTNGELWCHMRAASARLLPCSTYAIGSGAPYARTAMALGKTAAEAVKIAARFDTGTGSRVDSLSLKED